jgi:hypothetical protein
MPEGMPSIRLLDSRPLECRPDAPFENHVRLDGV